MWACQLRFFSINFALATRVQKTACRALRSILQHPCLPLHLLLLQTEQVIGSIPAAGPADVDAAVAAAEAAFRGGWRGTSGAERARYLRAIADKVLAGCSSLNI